ncbi:hypothetical protein EJ08DRAFT_693621 [Tothia fuscella]|uniref:Uncharacterized protein n=1 Tax=Tothia fuscella TaxID=1048955 RepID=A0A9P4P0S6_9PEZI|nr:hypothetical protein EJ08DRAFT_693621 [Tothia fuscella]
MSSPNPSSSHSTFTDGTPLETHRFAFVLEEQVDPESNLDYFLNFDIEDLATRTEMIDAGLFIGALRDMADRMEEDLLAAEGDMMDGTDSSDVSRLSFDSDDSMEFEVKPIVVAKKRTRTMDVEPQAEMEDESPVWEQSNNPHTSKQESNISHDAHAKPASRSSPSFAFENRKVDFFELQEAPEETEATRSSPAQRKHRVSMKKLLQKFGLKGKEAGRNLNFLVHMEASVSSLRIHKHGLKEREVGARKWAKVMSIRSRH